MLHHLINLVKVKNNWFVKLQTFVFNEYNLNSLTILSVNISSGRKKTNKPSIFLDDLTIISNTNNILILKNTRKNCIYKVRLPIGLKSVRVIQFITKAHRYVSVYLLAKIIKIYEDLPVDWSSFKDGKLGYLRKSVCKEFMNWAARLDGYRQYIIYLKRANNAIDKVYMVYSEIQSLSRDSYNQKYINTRKVECKIFLDNIEENPLTEMQKESVLTDDDSVQVIAGAGSGKTSVIVAKIAYLIKYCNVNPAEILALSFNKKVVAELCERCEIAFPKVGIDMSPKGISSLFTTFHSFGNSILDRSINLMKEKVYFEELNNVIAHLLDEPIYQKRFLDVFIYNSEHYKDPFDYDNEEAYKDAVKRYRLATLKGVIVKSFEEVEIANYLQINGINYIYEADCSFKLNGYNYRPDFYLPDYDIYIEHFGINRENQTAWGNSELYVAQIKEKKRAHQSNQTKLITTYSYDKREGKLAERLETQLKEFGVPISPQESIKRAFTGRNAIYHMTGLVKLIKETIDQYKANDLDVNILREYAKTKPNNYRLQRYIDLFEIIEKKYRARIVDRGFKDFSDMIGMAIEKVRNDNLSFPYKYIIADEFQDTSLGRFKLINEARKRSDKNCGVFVVGDDWQSINRFNGSDIDLFTSFNKYVDDPTIVKLDMTFRFDSRVNTIASDFIMENPKQLKKNIHTLRDGDTDSINLIYTPNDLSAIYEEINTIISNIVSTTKANEKFSVMILDRYNPSDDEKSLIKQLEKKYGKQVEIKRSSIHSSKGLGKDYVIVKGLCSENPGFPSSIEDDPIKDLFLPYLENFPNSEERRLFYVALTRVKKRLYLLADEQFPSIFVGELLKKHKPLISMSQEKQFCPSCNTGILTKHTSRMGRAYYLCNLSTQLCGKQFPACQNHHLDESAFLIRDGNQVFCSVSECTPINITCTQCSSGIMMVREKQSSYFWGCSSYSKDKKSCKTRRMEQKLLTTVKKLDL